MISNDWKSELLDPSYFLEEDVVFIARDLLGKEILANIDGLICRARITETEAYRAPDDRACHAYENRRTPRTETMFAEGGTAYLYLCYGIHHLFNVVTGPADVAHAVLIRAVEPLENEALMLQRRGLKKLTPALTAGPGRWTKAKAPRPVRSAWPAPPAPCRRSRTRPRAWRFPDQTDRQARR